MICNNKVLYARLGYKFDNIWSNGRFPWANVLSTYVEEKDRFICIGFSKNTSIFFAQTVVVVVV